jgi:hypothetical protein
MVVSTGTDLPIGEGLIACICCRILGFMVRISKAGCGLKQCLRA